MCLQKELNVVEFLNQKILSRIDWKKVKKIIWMSNIMKMKNL